MSARFVEDFRAALAGSCCVVLEEIELDLCYEPQDFHVPIDFIDVSSFSFMYGVVHRHKTLVKPLFRTRIHGERRSFPNNSKDLLGICYH